MRTAKEALARFNAQRTNRSNMCLWECQEAYGSPHRYPGAVSGPGASSQWNNGDQVRTTSSRGIPLGAPVYWYNPGRWGHIALYAGNGMVRTTEGGGRGRMGTLSIDYITRRWYPRGRFLGWTRDIGGVPIDFGGGATPAPAPAPKPTTAPLDIEGTEHMLIHETEGKPAYWLLISAPDKLWLLNVSSATAKTWKGPRVKMADAEWQRLLKHTNTMR